MNDEPTPTAPDATGPPESEPAVPPDVEPAPADSEPPAKRSMSWVWVLLAVLAVIALGWIFFAGQGVAVPDVVGLSQDQADVMLTEAGLRVGRVTDEPTLEVAPGIVVSQSPTAAEEAAKDSAVDISVSSIPKAEVPDVVGETQSEATALLAESGLLLGNVEYEESTETEAGYVIAQDPDAGVETAFGTPVSLTISIGEPAAEVPPQADETPEDGAAPPTETPDEGADSTVNVPDVVGLSQADAETTLEGAGLKPDATKANSADVAPGDVISQSPRAGTVMAEGSKVAITISKGAPDAPRATVPDVVGMGVLESIGVLRDANLKFSIAFSAAKENYFKVAAQDPTAGSEVDPGTTVTITIGLPDIASILEGLIDGSGEAPVTLPAAPEAGDPSEVTTP